MKTFNLAIFQCFTEGKPENHYILRQAMDSLKLVIDALEKEYDCKINIGPLDALVPKKAENFKVAYTELTGKEFTPENFEYDRNMFMKTADAVLFLREGGALSESRSFELGRFAERFREMSWGSRSLIMQLPNLEHPQPVIKTTLIRNAKILIADADINIVDRHVQLKKDELTAALRRWLSTQIQTKFPSVVNNKSGFLTNQVPVHGLVATPNGMLRAHL